MIYVVIILVVLLLLCFILYNRIIKLKLRCENAWASIDNQLKRRNDLIPNLVEVTKGYAKYECETLVELTKVRTNNISEESSKSDKISKNINKIFAVAEAYPDLKASELYKNLQLELIGTEDKIAYARQFYNDSVTMYNQKLQLFPSNIIAGMFNFQPRELFATESAEARKNVKVDFGKNS